MALDLEKKGQVPQILEMGLIGIWGRANEIVKERVRDCLGHDGGI